MGVFDQFPYTNFHELNLDWILQALKEIEKTMDQFVSINALKYADPIQWNITTQYEKNTIVIEPNSGTAYISVQPVPAGVNIDNTDYWTVVFDLGMFVVRAAKNLCSLYEEDTTNTATQYLYTNDWFVWGDTLYRVLSNIIPGDQFVIGSNIEHFTIESVTGHIENLTTSDKTNLVAAINEIVGLIGDLNNLTTIDKTNLVAAANEIMGIIGDLSTLTTYDQSSIVSAINEVDLHIKNLTIINVKDYGAVGDGITDDSQAFIDALAVTGALYIPVGEYLIDASTVAIPANKTIIGESSAESIVKNTSSSSLLKLNNHDVVKNLTFKANGPESVLRLLNISDVTLIDLMIDGDTCDYGLSVDGCSDLKISGIKAFNGNIDAATFNATESSFITSCEIYNAGRYGLTIGNSHDVVVSNSVVKNNTLTGNVIVNSSRIIIVGNLYFNNGYHGVQFNTCNRCVYSSTISSNNQYSGFDMYSTYSCKMIGCVSESNGTMGLEIDSMSFNNSVTGCTLRLNGSCGVTMFRSPRNVVMSNDIIDNGTAGAIPGFDPTPSGIFIHDDNTGLSRENIVAFNLIGDDQGTPTQHYGVQIEAGCVDITLIGNNFYTNLTGPVFIYDESQFASVKDNVGYTPAKYTTRIVTVTPYDATITGISGGQLYNMFDGSSYGMLLTSDITFTLDNISIAAYTPLNLATITDTCALPVPGITGSASGLAIITDGGGTNAEPCIVMLTNTGTLQVIVDSAHTAATQLIIQLFNIILPGNAVS